MSRLSLLMIKLARAIMPPERRDWAAAMEAEFPHVTENRTGFAAGCLWSALMANLVSRTRQFQASMALIAAFLIAVGAYAVWFTVAHVGDYGDQSISAQAAFAVGHMFVAVPSLIGAVGLLLGLKHADDRQRLAQDATRIIVVITLVCGPGWALAAGLLNWWQGADMAPMLVPLLVLATVFGMVGFAGLSGPKQLRDAGMAGTGAALLLAVFGSAGQVLSLPLVLVAVGGAVLHRLGNSTPSAA